MDNKPNYHVFKTTTMEAVTGKLDHERNWEADKIWAQNIVPELRGKQ